MSERGKKPRNESSDAGLSPQQQAQLDRFIEGLLGPPLRPEPPRRPALWRRAVAGCAFTLAKVIRKFRSDRPSETEPDSSAIESDRDVADVDADADADAVSGSTPSDSTTATADVHVGRRDFDHIDFITATIVNAIARRDLATYSTVDEEDEYRQFAARIDFGGRCVVDAIGASLHVDVEHGRSTIVVTGSHGHRDYAVETKGRIWRSIDGGPWQEEA